MSIAQINPDDVETFTLETNPARTYISSSTQGVTGNLNVFSRGSQRVKEVQPLSIFSQSFYNDMDLNTDIVAIDTAIQSGSTNVFDLTKTYLNDVTSQTPSARQQASVEIIRFIPSVDFSSNTLRKSNVVNNLMSFYRPVYPEAHFAFTNYHSLNFFTASTVQTQSVLLYPNPNNGLYSVNQSFSFDFWINPRYTTDLPDINASFKAGTIFHLSSSYAVSLITGSSKDINGFPNGFRIMLQLSNDADIAPSLAATGSGAGRIYLSDDNAIKLNNWHHVTIRWDNNLNNHTGSFFIDEIPRGVFVLTQSINTSFLNPPSVLCVGNYYEGTNGGTSAQALFFSTPNSQRDGVLNLVADPSEGPTSFAFTHPLNAEVHELKIYNRSIQDHEIKQLGTNGPTGSLLTHYQPGIGGSLLFYLPPFFTRESPTRTFTNGFGGVLITPFQTRNGTTAHPVNVDLLFGVAGHYINLENYTRDFATGNYPRLFALTASTINGTTNAYLSVDQYLYTTGSNIRRSLMVLPNDNGKFYPNFNVFSGSNLDLSTFIDDHGSYTPGFVTLRNMLPTASVGFGLIANDTSESFFRGIYTALPEAVFSSSVAALITGDVTGSELAIYHRTQDNTSNQVVFFDISNLYYGNSVMSGTINLIDTAMSNSDGKVKMTLRDDGQGNIFRGDCLTPHATWNSVGNVFYNEGVIMLKNPSTFFFGKDQFKLNFRGTQNIHVLTYNLFKRPLQVLSSSNPSYLPVSSSDNANETDSRFVLITGVYLHDENLNIIAKTQLAQPVPAKTADKLLFKVKFDF